MGYNGASGDPYNTISLSDVLPDQQAGFGTVAVDFTGLQNGSPDGIALISDTGSVVQFLSYEGSFTAASGPAAGVASTDIGQSENSNTRRGHSLQLGGAGGSYGDFSWESPQNNTRGQPNRNQTFQ